VLDNVSPLFSSDILNKLHVQLQLLQIQQNPALVGFGKITSVMVLFSTFDFDD